MEEKTPVQPEEPDTFDEAALDEDAVSDYDADETEEVEDE